MAFIEDRPKRIESGKDIKYKTVKEIRQMLKDKGYPRLPVRYEGEQLNGQA